MLGEFVVELIVKPLFEFVGYGTGKLVIRVVSLGLLDASLLAEPDREGKRNKRWYSITFTRGNKRFVDAHVVAVSGMFVWIALIVAGVLFIRGW